MPTPAFSFLKTRVQTRAKGHTAEGHYDYVFGESGTSSLETPIRSYHAKDPKERRRVIRMDPPRRYDYRNRNDIVAKGYATPEGAAAEWRDGHEWARRIEAAEGKRTDSRQLRDDIVGLPLALVEQGKAGQALRDYAHELARAHRTPVHYAIHSPHKGSRNWHAHVLYAGRKLTADGQAFERRRDRSQDKPELIERHKAIWTKVCRRYGLELDFTPQHPEGAPAPEPRLTARTIATERRAAAREEGARLNAAIVAVGGAPLPPQEQQMLGETSLDLDGLDTAGLLALPRTPATTGARIAKYARRSIPVPAPAMTLRRARPVPGASVVACEMRHERPAPAPAPAPAWRPDPPCVPESSSHLASGSRPIGLLPTPAAPRVLVRARPRAAPAIEAPEPEHARPAPAPAIGTSAPIPPWRAARKWLRHMKTWWPWAGRPPRPEKTVRIEPPPLDLPRPGPALRIDPLRRRPPAPVPVLVFRPETRGGGPSVRRGIAPRPSRKRTTRPAPAPPARARRDEDWWN